MTRLPAASAPDAVIPERCEAMRSGFTPGPWRAVGSDDRYEADCIPIKAGEHQVAEAYAWQTEHHPNMTVAEGEARLIAAAPELYGAADRTFRSMTGDRSITVQECMEALEAALAKARGEA